MSPLKSAYDLANERLIPSRYAGQVEREKKEAERQRRIDDGFEMPDFIEGEKPQEEEEPRSGVLLGEETPFHSQDEAAPEDFDRSIEAEAIMAGDQALMELQWYGHFTSYSGFSRMNRAMVFGLCNRNMRVKIDPQKCAVEINYATLKELNLLEHLQISPYAPKVFGATIPLNMFHSGKKILYTMMESSSLHKDYVEKLNLFDEVWVPSEYGVKLCQAEGVKVPLYHMPLGVDIDRYTSVNREAARQSLGVELNSFVFLSVFKWGFRKGYDILLKAYLEEFSNDEDVSLLMVSRTDVIHDAAKIQKDFQDIRSFVKKDDADLPHICLYDNTIPERKMPEIYRAGDCFVLISRGEGFGLPYYEAAATEVPIIGSYCSGQSDLLTEENSYLVHPSRYDKQNRLTKMGKTCHFYEDQVFPEFGSDSLEQTKAHMRYVYENYSDAMEKAKIMRQKVAEYTWDKSIDKVHKRLLEIGGEK